MTDSLSQCSFDLQYLRPHRLKSFLNSVTIFQKFSELMTESVTKLLQLVTESVIKWLYFQTIATISSNSSMSSLNLNLVRLKWLPNYSLHSAQCTSELYSRIDEHTDINKHKEQSKCLINLIIYIYIYIISKQLNLPKKHIQKNSCKT